MSSLDIQALLAPISEDAPSGLDLEYDPEMAKLEEVARGSQEQQYGDTIIAAEPPDWRLACKLAKDLLSRTKDIRIAIHLGNSFLALGDLDAFGDCIQLIKCYLTDFWDSVYPQLDVDDDDDPTSRVNALIALCDRPSTILLANRAPIVKARGLGNFSLLDVEIANGDAAVPPNYEHSASTAEIDAAFENTDLELLLTTQANVASIIDNLEAIESSVTSKVGAGSAMSLDPLREIFQSTLVVVERYVQQRTNDGESSAEVAADATAPAVASAAVAASGTAEINNRADVIRAIDRICDYYKRVEPSSPLPLLLNRAKRLATKSFLDIIKDLTPDALAQAAALGGQDESADDDDDDS